MLSFIKWLQEELEKVTAEEVEAVNATELDDVGEGEEVIAEVMDDSCKKLFTIFKKLCREHKEAVIAAAYAKMREEMLGEKGENPKGSIALIESKIQATAKIFWASIKMDFPEANNPGSIGIKKGWKIVSSPAENTPQELPEEILKMFPGCKIQCIS